MEVVPFSIRFDLARSFVLIYGADDGSTSSGVPKPDYFNRFAFVI
jgi:hypothetical protein